MGVSVGFSFIPGQLLGLILFAIFGIGGILAGSTGGLIFGLVCLVVAVLIAGGWFVDHLKQRKLLKKSRGK